MSEMQKVDGFASLRKDPYSGGVVNVDKQSFNAHQQAKRLALQQLQEKKMIHENVENMQDEINNIKGELTDIKVLLMQLINKGQ